MKHQMPNDPRHEISRSTGGHFKRRHKRSCDVPLPLHCQHKQCSLHIPLRTKVIPCQTLLTFKNPSFRIRLVLTHSSNSYPSAVDIRNTTTKIIDITLTRYSSYYNWLFKQATKTVTWAILNLKTTFV
jgi:hypothetical protein